MKSFAFLLAGALLLTLGQGHYPFGVALIAGMACVAFAFRHGRAALLLPSFTLLHIGVGELAYRGMVPMDVGPRLGMWLGVSLTLGLILMVDGRIARRTRSFGATLVLPAGWVAFDLLSARFSPGGSWGSYAYSFVEPLALAQVVALFGWTALTFLAVWAGSALAWSFEVERRQAVRGLGIVALVFLALIVHGSLRLRTASEGGSLATACLVAPSTYGKTDETVNAVWAYTRGIPIEPAESRLAQSLIAASLEEHLVLAEEALAADAELVVFAEATASISEAERAEWIARFGELAQRQGAWIGIGWMVFDPGEVLTSRNELVVLGPDGDVAIEFLKATRPPGASHEISGRVPPPTQLGSALVAPAICFDLDFPQLFPAVGRAGADVLLAPSNDWEQAAVTHARMARLRGIEQGAALLRPTKSGVTLVCDRYGRELAARDTLGAETSVVLAELPLDGAPTLYARSGDAFAWLCLAGFVLGASGLRLRRRPASVAGN